MIIFLPYANAEETDIFYREFSLGAGMDITGYSRTAFSLGGIISTDYRFSPSFAAGFKAGYGYDLDSLTNAEAFIFARWYFLSYPKPLKGLMVFAQIEGGGAGLWEKRVFTDANQQINVWSPSGALGVGIRLKLPFNFYVEPYIRGGYPFIWSAALIIGHTFISKPLQTKTVSSPEEPPAATPEPEKNIGEPPSTEQNSPEQKQAEQKPVEQKPPEQKQAEQKPAAVVVKEPPQTRNVTETFGNIIFRDNGSDFTDLDSEIVFSNNEILDNLADFLKQNPGYKLRIEGYANPVQTTEAGKQMEDRIFLQPISRERAVTILEMLAQRGISRQRMNAVGLGGSKTVVNIDDPDNWRKNRRVEFVLVK
ncbi:MAG: OmpA family protein [Treponema sp.]|nr:OmpA family protein [Treponema sp.]